MIATPDLSIETMRFNLRDQLSLNVDGWRVPRTAG